MSRVQRRSDGRKWCLRFDHGDKDKDNQPTGCRESVCKEWREELNGLDTEIFDDPEETDEVHKAGVGLHEQILQQIAMHARSGTSKRQSQRT